MSDPDNLTIRVLSSLSAVAAADWDACAGADNPFVSHAFLKALEDSGSVGAEAGWRPQHLVLEDPAGGMLGAAPLYLKSHSFGEYVFDWGWADAWERAGGRYYPKLQGAVPFSPVTGPRLLVRPGARAAFHRQALAAGMVELAGRLEVSSLHLTFCTGEEAEELAPLGFIHRLGQQFHWRNEGYGSFDDFLAELASRKRKAIRKERQTANSHGLTIRTLSGEDIKPRHWDAFHRFYLATTDKKWGEPYLSRDFFHRLGQTLGDQVVLVMGFDGDGPEAPAVCGALNLRGGDSLFGRNWGTLAELPCLHFEVCYYRAIEYAIDHGLTWVEAGAQGGHKVQRGYLPRATHSLHWIAHPGFREAVADFVEQERQAVHAEIHIRTTAGPFRQGR
ncbi:GNAT family N-acetyltransferase [Roseospirillum parvum]|uniref:Uncharacterized protein n=1 Tax=Roseospirillum parvum TaxID=83401 RepID=A0A1G7XJ77_9PROT|nr:GNAT family N-acetyltransferase [Roseospirillum parvum]SDG84176.1 hypothetical protein SAMN05421742_1032 [Roseospirillum parvum]